jgi:hypothetical protein
MTGSLLLFLVIRKPSNLSAIAAILLSALFHHEAAKL